MKKIKSCAAVLITLTSIIFLGSCSEPDIPKGYALLYGVTDYSGYFPDLSLTDDDVVAFAELLESKGWIVKYGLNATASMESLDNDIEEVASQIESNDRFLFYYSGHGGPVNLENNEPDSASNVRDEAIILYGDYTNMILTDDMLAEKLSVIPAENKIVIIDACNSGGFLGDGFTYNSIDADYTKYEFSDSFTPAESLSLYINYSPSGYDLSHNTFTVLAAAGEDELSFENPVIGHGVFTYYLLNSPEYADYNQDGYITLIEAYRFTADNLDRYFNEGSSDDYMPHVAAFPVDPVLFKAD